MKKKFSKSKNIEAYQDIRYTKNQAYLIRKEIPTLYYNWNSKYIKQKILKSTKEKSQGTGKCRSIWTTTDFSIQTIKVRRLGLKSFKL